MSSCVPDPAYHRRNLVEPTDAGQKMLERLDARGRVRELLGRIATGRPGDHREVEYENGTRVGPLVP